MRDWPRQVVLHVVKNVMGHVCKESNDDGGVRDCPRQGVLHLTTCGVSSKYRRVGVMSCMRDWPQQDSLLVLARGVGNGRRYGYEVAMRDWPRQIVLQMEVREVGQRGGTLGDGCLLDRPRQGVSDVLWVNMIIGSNTKKKRFYVCRIVGLGRIGHMSLYKTVSSQIAWVNIHFFFIGSIV